MGSTIFCALLYNLNRDGKIEMHFFIVHGLAAQTWPTNVNYKFLKISLRSLIIIVNFRNVRTGLY